MLPTRAASAFHAAVHDAKIARLARAAKKTEALLKQFGERAEQKLTIDMSAKRANNLNTPSAPLPGSVPNNPAIHL